MRAARDMAVLAIMVDSKLASQKIADLKFCNASLIINGDVRLQDPKNLETFITVSPNTAILIRKWVQEVINFDPSLAQSESPLFFSLKFSAEDNRDKIPLKRDAITKIFQNSKASSGVSRLTRTLLNSGSMQMLSDEIMSKFNQNRRNSTR
jgi:hypothetical protein